MKRRLTFAVIIVLFCISMACEISFSEDAETEPDLDATLAAVLSEGNPAGGMGSNCHLITNIRDVNYPPGSAVNPGEKITKTWQLTNGGTCAWTSGYRIARVSMQDNAILAVYGIGQAVNPGETITISVPIEAPLAGGMFTYYYMLMDESSSTFGYDSGAAKPFWVSFQVTDSGQAPAADEGQPAPAQPAQPEPQNDEPSCTYSGYALIQPVGGIKLDPNESFDVRYILTNTGTCTWDANSRLEMMESTIPQTVTSVTTGKTVAAGENVELTIPIRAGITPGHFNQFWKLVTQHGDLLNFGNDTSNVGLSIFGEIKEPEVPDEPETPTFTWNLPSGDYTWVGLQKCGTVPSSPIINIEAGITSVNYEGLVHVEIELMSWQIYPPAEDHIFCSVDPSIPTQISPGQSKTFNFQINRNQCPEMNNHVKGGIYYYIVTDMNPDAYVENGMGFKEFESTCLK